MNPRDAYDRGFEDGVRAGREKAKWVGLTEDEMAQLVVDYGEDMYALIIMTAEKLQEKNT